MATSKGMTEKALCRVGRLLGIVMVLAQSPHVAASDGLHRGLDAYVRGDYGEALAILSPAATSDNPRIQNLVALMIYEGRGIAANAVAAHDLFHRAAAAGVTDARRNLGILHSIGAGALLDYAEARMWLNAASAGSDAGATTRAGFNDIPAAIKTVIELEFRHDGNGKRTYLTFCAGCHGFNGMRFLPAAPSFAMGERMTKGDAELMQSILHGKGLMPSWEDKLPVSDLEDALGYLRELALRTAYGTDVSAFNAQPARYFIFSPIGLDPRFLREWRTSFSDSD